MSVKHEACTVWKILKCRCSVVHFTASWTNYLSKMSGSLCIFFSWLFPLQCLKFPEMNYMCYKNLLKIGIPQPFPCPAKSKLPLNLLLWMSCCLAVANLMANLMAENYMYMWVVPTSTTYSSYLTRLFSVFFSQCLLRSSWALLNCSFIFISYKGNSASFPIFQFLIAKNAHRLSRLLDLSYRIAQFLPTNDMLHPRPFPRICNLRSVLSMSVSNSEPLWTIMHSCCTDILKK